MKFSLAFIIGLVAFLINLSGGMVWTTAALWGIAFWIGSAVVIWILVVVLIAIGAVLATR
ncbi:putative signal/transmembrane protein [Klebsiella phage SAKp28]